MKANVQTNLVETDALKRLQAVTATEPDALLRRQAGFWHGAIESRWLAGSFGINEVNAAVDDLIGADRCPVNHVGGVFNMEPRAIRAGGVKMEHIPPQQAGAGVRRLAIENDDCGRCRSTDQIVGAWNEFENNGAGDVGRAIIQRHDGDGGAELAGQNGHVG